MSTLPIELQARSIAMSGDVSLRRCTFLMCPPKLYDVNYVINPWMEGNVRGSSRLRATEQWNRLYDALSTVADIELIEPQPGSPDMVFTANAGLERDGLVVLSSFFHPERQGEESHFRRWFQEAGYVVREVVRETPFEGEGDALFGDTAAGTKLFAGYGPRTLLSSHAALKCAWDVEVVSLELIDPRFYHLDTCFAPLQGGFVMYCPQAFSDTSLASIEACYPADRRIPVSEQDAVNFACNAINVGRTIILNRITDGLRAELEQRGFEVIQVSLTEFLKAGGAAKCLVMKLGPVAQ